MTESSFSFVYNISHWKPWTRDDERIRMSKILLCACESRPKQSAQVNKLTTVVSGLPRTLGEV